jgi:hypothetical protein
MNLETLKYRLVQLDAQRPLPLKVMHLCWFCQQDLRKTDPCITTEFQGKTIIEEALQGVTRCINCRYAEYLQGQ